MDNKDYSGLLLQNITRSLPSSKIEDNWQACSRSRGFSQTKSQETTANTSLPPTNAIITSSCSGFNAEYPSSFLVTKLHFLLCRVDCQRMIWTTMNELHSEKWAYEYQNCGGDLWRKQNTAIWLKTHNFIHVADTKPSIGVQPNYPHTRYVGLCPTNNGSTKSVWVWYIQHS